MTERGRLAIFLSMSMSSDKPITLPQILGGSGRVSELGIIIHRRSAGSGARTLTLAS